MVRDFIGFHWDLTIFFEDCTDQLYCILWSRLMALGPIILCKYCRGLQWIGSCEPSSWTAEVRTQSLIIIPYIITFEGCRGRVFSFCVEIFANLQKSTIKYLHIMHGSIYPKQLRVNNHDLQKSHSSSFFLDFNHWFSFLWMTRSFCQCLRFEAKIDSLPWAKGTLTTHMDFQCNSSSWHK